LFSGGFQPIAGFRMLSGYVSYISKMLAGDLAAFGGPLVEEPEAGQIRAEQITLVLGHAPGMMVANACNAAVLAIALWYSPDRNLAVVWAASMIMGAVFFGLKARSSWRISKPQAVSRKAMHNVVRNAFVMGCMWAIVPIAFFADATSGGQLVMTCLCAGMIAGGAFAFATMPIAAICFTGPIFVGSAICIARSGDFTYLLVAILVVVYACVLLRGVFSNSFEFTNRLTRQFANEKAVRQDTLTGLANRFAFNEGLKEALARFGRSGEGFAVLMLDLDRFKEVNDQFGHPAGDEFLIQVAARLRRCTREMDSIARIGGDEFAFIAADVNKPEAALEAARRLDAAFAEPFLIDGREFVSSTSIGIVLSPRDGTTPNDLLKRVDVALYRAKKVARGTIRFFQPEDDSSARDRLALLRDLEMAIERDQLFLVYQPVFSLREKRVSGFEALLRWRHPERGLLAPNEFIAIAEESGLIHSIGEWVVRRACATLVQWPKEIRIAVNFSAVQFQKVTILQTVVAALGEAGVSPTRMEVEITESMLISQHDLAISLLKSLTELGVTLALDDFGTGFSSLTYLRRLPFSRIKIDQSFVRDMLTQPDCAAIVKSAIALAKDLHIEVVAEGVESSEQLEFLQRNRCDEVQGHLFGRPMTFDRAKVFLDELKGLGINAA
jgi:diguanylate cyclase (GGDEF)-like protein